MMRFDRDQERALAYVLRLWRVTDGTPPVWRASLQDVLSGERHGFAGLDEATAYLRRQLELLSGSGQPDREDPAGQ